MSEPSRQQKWVRIKQEVTRTPEEGAGAGGIWVRLPFPVVSHSDLAGKCVRIQVRLVISWRISLIFFSRAFRQMAGNHSFWSTDGSGHHCGLEELFSERAGGRGDSSCPLEPLGNLRHIGCFVGCAWRVVSAGYSL